MAVILAVYLQTKVIHRDGQRFLEMEMTDYRFLDRIDDSEFARPEGEQEK